MVGGRLNTSADRGVLATDDDENPLTMPAVRELDLDLNPEFEVEFRVPLLEKVDDVPVRVPPFKVVPVKWIGVGSAGCTEFG